MIELQLPSLVWTVGAGPVAIKEELWRTNFKHLDHLCDLAPATFESMRALFLAVFLGALHYRAMTTRRPMGRLVHPKAAFKRKRGGDGVHGRMTRLRQSAKKPRGMDRDRGDDRGPGW